MITNKELARIRERLTRECIDDPEELLDWFAYNGVSMINELLALREQVAGEQGDIVDKG